MPAPHFLNTGYERQKYNKWQKMNEKEGYL
jgi:hypothetical protein